MATSTIDMQMLDNPIWNSLTTGHAHLALGAEVGRGLARRYISAIGPLSALKTPTTEAYADLAAIVPAGDIAVLFLEDVAQPPPGWELLRDGPLAQMICPSIPPAPEIPLTPLQPEDYPDMHALAELTEPGPFRARTPELGGFLGVRVEGRLAAMTGQRLSLDGFTELTAVCTHPDFRGRGYAQALVAQVTRNIHASGKVPFLTVFAHNTGAIHVYERLGFSIRRTFQLAALKPPAA